MAPTKIKAAVITKAYKTLTTLSDTSMTFLLPSKQFTSFFSFCNVKKSSYWSFLDLLLSW